MLRITQKMLENRVEYLNDITDNPKASWTKRPEGGMKANIGNYHLDWAYGGVKLVQHMNEGGGITTITDGYDTKRELMGKIDAYISGVRVAA